MKELAIIFTLLVTNGPQAGQNDALTAARDLYASAAYEQALSELMRLRTSDPSTQDIDVYRAFCLIALGRTAEAEAVADSLLRRDPLLVIDAYADASPRITAVFATVQKRVLPEMIRGEYRAARSLPPAKAADVEAHLTSARDLLEHAKTIGAWDDTLDDLHILIDGFLDLARARSGAAAASNSPAAAPEAVMPAAPLQFSAADSTVVAPVVISQSLPYVPPALLDLVKRLHGTEILEVAIDERGRVENVAVTRSVNSAYDSLMVAAARQWRYKPAMKDGRPVRFVKSVVIDAGAQ